MTQPVNVEPNITVRAIAQRVALRRRVPERELYSNRRGGAANVEARQIVCWLARQLTTLSMPVIGRRLNRDHSTVLHGIAVVNRRREHDAEFAADVDALYAELAGAARQPLVRLPRDVDPVGAAARVAASGDPVREGMRLSSLEVAAIAQRAVDLEECAGATFQLLARVDRALELTGDERRDYTAGTRALVDSIVSALEALGFTTEEEGTTNGQTEDERREPARAAE